MGQIHRGTEIMPQSPFSHKVCIWCVSTPKIQLPSEIAVGRLLFSFNYSGTIQPSNKGVCRLGLNVKYYLSVDKFLSRGGWTHFGNGIKGSGDRGLHFFSPFSNPFLASVSILSRKPKKLEDTRINQRFIISLYQKCSLFWSRKCKCTSNFYSCNF